MNEDRPTSGPGKKPASRRAPPELTGREGEWWIALKESGRSIEVRLADGETLRGTVTYMDLSVIKLAPPDGPTRLIRKKDIRWVAECETRDDRGPGRRDDP